MVKIHISKMLCRHSGVRF